MNSRGIVAIVPMKPFNLTKTRLSDRLTPPQRMALSLVLLKKVVRAAVESGVDKVWVVGGDAAVRETSLDLGAEWCVDDGKDLNDSLNKTIEQAFDLELAAMYLPADLPFVTSEGIDTAIDASDQGNTLTLSPAHRDGGTNAVIIPCGSEFRLTLGLDSFKRHQDRAESLQLKVAICDLPGLGFDLDTPDDLDVYENSVLSKKTEIGKVSD